MNFDDDLHRGLIVRCRTTLDVPAAVEHAARRGRARRRVETAPRVIPSGPDFFRLLPGYHVQELFDGSVITPERATRWGTAMDDAAASGHFTGGGTAFNVCGTVN